MKKIDTIFDSKSSYGNKNIYETNNVLKQYDDESEFNPSTLAQESILKEYGYTVSQKENLSEEERHTIIEEVIDNGDMTKSQVINLLESMINLRQYQDKYKIAISKWKKDIEFVKKYKK